MFFMPPRPYLPDGTLHAAICYPSPPELFSSALIEELIKLAGLKDLLGQLEQTDSWEHVLTREQQQRLGLVRLLLYRPKWILVQEAFDSLDPDGEKLMLSLICQELPDTAMLTISNQPSAAAFHNRRIIL
jgi:putative ATP-binding cassette transporter